MDAATFDLVQSMLYAQRGLSVRNRFVDLADPPMRVHVTEVGSGEPLVLIHGGNSVAMSWLPLLPALASRFRVILPDRPGCGLTGPFDYRGVDLRAHGAAFVAGLLDGLGLERAALAANSMGGYFALAFAVEHPERVSRLILLGEPAGSSERAPLFHRLVGTRGLNALLYATVLRPPGDAVGLRQGWAKGRLVVHPDRVPDDLAECLAAGARLPGASRSWRRMVERVFVPAGSGVFARGMRATRALAPELARVSCPTLFLWGSEDPLGAPDVGRGLAERMPDARLVEIPDAGHLPWIDQPDRCATGILEFLPARPAEV
ncbi:alpha/beta fold hydrolase [Microbacterium sp. ASV49]|uniref:Alpha/beta hydrolase n=1 Tax=Microbacterium candidum TaxID=3041922 RepID=A0ABT7N3J9_9MICO|nr:alpha/beta hydrolase [Microbacterium sp. ASV49]MDL9981282.1 alpha/beta hydrolase [Microbacterium sp. ASV49]